MATFVPFLLVLSCTGSAVYAQQEMRLVREKAHPDDDFLLPSDTPECPRLQPSGLYSPKCSQYGSASLGGCWCQCGTPTGENTFYEPTYSCLKVSEARQRAGCDLLFTDETVDSALRFFPTSTVTQKAINVPANKTCTFQFGEKLYAQYLSCDGNWNEIPSESVKQSLEVNPGWTTSRLQMMRKDGVTTIFQNNTGRMFRVAVQCRDQHDHTITSSTCVLFKVEGTTYCPIPQQNSSRPSATLPTPTLETINTTGSTLFPWTNPAVTTGPDVTVTREVPRTTGGETTQEGRVTQNPNPNPGGEGTKRPTEKVAADSVSQKANKKNTFIIAGAVAGGILLIALILLILWRCNNPKKRHNPHSRLEGSVSGPISQMSRNSIPVYTDAAHMTPVGVYSMRTNSMDNPTYRKGHDGVIIGPEYKHATLYSDSYPSGAPPRPPMGKRGSMNGQVNPGLSLNEDIVTLNPLYEGQVVDHKDLDELNCSDFAVYPEQVVLEDRKNPIPDEFDQTYDCPEEILNTKPMTSTPLVPVYYVVDDPYPVSISSTFRDHENGRGRPDGHVYDRPEGDLSRGGSYIVMDHPNAVAYAHGYDEPPHDDELLNTRRRSNHGILKVGSASPNAQRYPSQSSYDDGHVQVI